MLRHIILLILGLLACQLNLSDLHAQRNESRRYAIAIHGGAGGSPKRLSEQQRTVRKATLERILKAAVAELKEGKAGLGVVERVIRKMEDDPQFNAGRGAVMNEKGQFELDASIMDGRDRSCGAVAGVGTVKNPISLARLVMTETRHVLLATHGAEEFATLMKVERADANYFRTESRQRSYESRKRKEAEKSVDAKGTVGCVVLDTHGNISAGTSTGGLMFKRFGRVGDSPIIGAGTFADNKTCGVSGTGIGEHFIRNAVGYDVSARMAYGKQSLEVAVKEVIHGTLKPGYGGLIAVSHLGEVAMDFNTEGMSRAAANSQGVWIVELD